MRIIPKKTKVATEFFKGLSLADVLVGLFGCIVLVFVFVSNLPYKLYITIGATCFFGALLFRMDEEPIYVMILSIIKHFSVRRRYKGVDAKPPSDEEYFTEIMAPQESKDKPKKGKKSKAKKAAAPAEAKSAEAQNAAAPADAKSAEAQNAAAQADTKTAKGKKAAAPAGGKSAKAQKGFSSLSNVMPFTEISDNCIGYAGEYYGAAIEIPAVEFRFFSLYRQDNSIDRAFGAILRSAAQKYSANLVKVDRPVIYDSYVAGEKQKIKDLETAYINNLFSAKELKIRVSVIQERIAELEKMNNKNKVLLPFYYLVIYESTKPQLEMQINAALASLRTGELTPKRLNSKELAVFLRYTNEIDFDEREIENVLPENYAQWAYPSQIEIKSRTIEMNNIITHNMRVISYPTSVSNAWGATMFAMPGCKVVMKMKPIDRTKAIRSIDRSIDELRSQEAQTGKSSKLIEIAQHIETLAELLLMLQSDNETLMQVNIYITAYDVALTATQKKQDIVTANPYINGLKKYVRRTLGEQQFKFNDLMFSQFQALVGSQISGYDPFAKNGREIHSSSIAAVYPFVYAYLSDIGGVTLGKNDNIPTFINFFRRDSERVNSNMVIVGKSGSGKSYATKTLLTNLAAENSKIFVLDPENEYNELAANLGGKLINVGNASQGRLNPFTIIASLEDEEQSEGVSSSYSAHLQFLEEFFKQILVDIDADALEYLNNMITRVYNNKNIDETTDIAKLSPEDFPVFDDLYDLILEEFQNTKSEYLRQSLRVLMNYIAKFSTGGRNSALWNGPSSITTEENFVVFNFQSLLANRNNMVANAQMLLILKWLDNEIIKNRDYNLKYNEQRKIVVVIDEAHVFIDIKYPLALDFMFQLAKRIRKYNGMQIVITQNIKDFVGSEEIARKSTAIINACQYSFIFALAPNDMHDLCRLYEKAGEINEQEQEKIINAPRGEAFVVTSPTRRTSLNIVAPPAVQHLFTKSYDEEQQDMYAEEWKAYFDSLDARKTDKTQMDEPAKAKPSNAKSSKIKIVEISEKNIATKEDKQGDTANANAAQQGTAPMPAEDSDAFIKNFRDAIFEQTRIAVQEATGGFVDAISKTAPLAQPQPLGAPMLSEEDDLEALMREAKEISSRITPVKITEITKQPEDKAPVSAAKAHISAYAQEQEADLFAEDIAAQQEAEPVAEDIATQQEADLFAEDIATQQESEPAEEYFATEQEAEPAEEYVTSFFDFSDVLQFNEPQLVEDDEHDGDAEDDDAQEDPMDAIYAERRRLAMQMQEEEEQNRIQAEKKEKEQAPNTVIEMTLEELMALEV